MNLYQPMMARTAEKSFNDPDWLFEVKWDGIRAMAYVNEDVSLRTRNDNEIIGKFPEFSELSSLASNVVLDGEIVILTDGLPDFQAVASRNQQQSPRDIRAQAAKRPATYIVFDILEANGVSLIDHPLDERLEILENNLRQGRYVVRSQPVRENGVEYYEAVLQKNLEGIMAKRRDSPYQPGARSPDWLKIKQVKTCDCVVFGYTAGTGSRASTFGALLLGLYDGEKPVYVGRVGTGFSDEDLQEISSRLESMQVDHNWFDEEDIPRDSRWVEPGFVAEIGYQEVTEDQRLRSPRFQGFREDKPAQLCSINQIRPQRLREYYNKRDFSETTEPRGGSNGGSGNSYVVQKHDATRLHYDLRLERDSVLVSWAVPKGIPLELGERRLVIRMEDHPLEYGGFEGIIPDGQYGAGTVEIWDKGFYVPVKWMPDKIEFVVAGERVHGRYELIRFKEADEDQWLLFKKKAQ
jgi:DNA ligase D-like protein (predicted ligase)/DNA ligase D-like protein (predicted 3'-phosphoesterase)